ncbi:hypothetical protein GGH94_004156 [Coemansia aciculifera]|uniref:histidine--tRNA ligase n=1 Tax=Coemansia aciculifera TaxID=417176 RepID=A0A9W8IPT5_9FUNG|nr:hypothetical protein GGH94_004156 [Coemansia aciculifera]
MSQLQPYVDCKVSVVMNDGRLVVGILRGLDQTTNIIMQSCQERIFSEDEAVEVVDLGLYMIRGDNIAIIGLVDEVVDAALDLDSYSTQPPRSVRGMADRLGITAYKHRYIISQAEATAESYGFEPIHTPILEYSSVYERSLGADSDVVGKELYKFLDSSQQWMTMRPEGTAGVARALITNKLEGTMPQKFYYSGPMFRHERPQKGRLRQFEQFGVEALGASHPAVDVESIEMAWQFLNRLGLNGDLSLRLNTLGDKESRTEYRTALQQYFTESSSRLSEDSLRRLTTNPMRILDSKDEADIAVAKGAPVYSDYLSSSSRERFDFIKQGLEEQQIPYTLDHRLVRGLDYYQHTVWEVSCASDLLGRSQATVLAGGRYDGLTLALGGSRSLPGIGWAAGIERLALLLPDNRTPAPQPAIPILIVPDRSLESGSGSRVVEDGLYRYALSVASAVRKQRSVYVVHAPVHSSENRAGLHPPLSKQLASVLSKTPAPPYVLIVGSNEVGQRHVIVRDSATQKQTVVELDQVISHLDNR